MLVTVHNFASDFLIIVIANDRVDPFCISSEALLDEALAAALCKHLNSFNGLQAIACTRQ